MQNKRKNPNDLLIPYVIFYHPDLSAKQKTLIGAIMEHAIDDSPECICILSNENIDFINRCFGNTRQTIISNIKKLAGTRFIEVQMKPLRIKIDLKKASEETAQRLKTLIEKFGKKDDEACKEQIVPHLQEVLKSVEIYMEKCGR